MPSGSPIVLPQSAKSKFSEKRKSNRRSQCHCMAEESKAPERNWRAKKNISDDDGSGAKKLQFVRTFDALSGWGLLMYVTYVYSRMVSHSINVCLSFAIHSQDCSSPSASGSSGSRVCRDLVVRGNRYS